MSVATKRALDRALAAHIADEEPGAFVCGYVLQVEFDTLEPGPDHGGLTFETADGQTLTTTIGITDYLHQRVHAHAGRMFRL